MAGYITGGNLNSVSIYDSYRNPNSERISKNDFLSAMGAKKFDDRNLTNLYWDTVDKYHASIIANNLNTGIFDTPFDYTRSSNIGNIYGNRNAWNVLNNLVHGQNGHIISFDTETIGDFTSNTSGITEISFATKKFGRSKNLASPEGSFVFGIDSEQKEWLISVLEKKKKGEVLSQTEESAMERMSRYSAINHDGYFFSTSSQDWNGMRYNLVNQLNLSNPDSIADIESGIKELSNLYDSQREEQISNVIDFFNKQVKKSDTVFMGQNLEYDINVINQYSALKHTSALSDINYVDSIKALRAYAESNNTTVAEIVKKVNPNVNNRFMGSLETLMAAVGDPQYASSMAHNAYEDSLATIKIFENHDLGIIDKALSVLNDVESNPNTLTLKDSLVKINKKGNIKSEDLLIINNQVVSDYQVANQYWKFQGTGRTVFDALTITDSNGQERELKGTKDKLIAYFENTDNSGAKLFKAFDTEAQLQEWFSQNTNIVNAEQIDIPLQTKIRNKDIARRTIEGFFQPSRTDAEHGGFREFSNYYSFYKDLSELSDKAVSSMGLRSRAGLEIKTAQSMLSNISYQDNIVKVLDYSRNHDIQSVNSIFGITGRSGKKTSLEIATSKYDTRFRLEEVFDTFDSNKGFFEYAYDSLKGKKTNLEQTVAFEALKNVYVDTNSTNVVFNPKEFSRTDINTITIPLYNGESINIDVSDPKTAASRINNAFGYGKSDIEKSIDIKKSAKLLYQQGLLSEEQYSTISLTHEANLSSYNVADSLANALYTNTQELRNLSQDEYRERYIGLLGLDKEAIGITNKFIKNKNQKTLLESATSDLSLIVGGELTEEFNSEAEKILSAFDNTNLIEGFFDLENEYNKEGMAAYSSIRSRIKRLNYDDSSIEDFMKVFYTNSTSKSNINTLNQEIAEDANKVVPIFFSPNRDKTANYMILTRQKDYGKAVSALSSLDDSANQRAIKESLEGIGAYFEIPYLDVIDLDTGSESDDIIRKLTTRTDYNGKVHEGHGARTVIVKQGDNYARYDTMNLNIYRDSKTGNFTGYIQDAGGSYLTSIRQRMSSAVKAISEGDYESAIRWLNNPNISKMAEASAPQFNGLLDINGDLIKDHMFTQKDLDYAYIMAFEPESSTGLLKYMEELITDESIKKAGNLETNEGLNTLLALYNVFDEKYDLTVKRKGVRYNNIENAERVFNSEYFKQFFERNITGQTNGIFEEEFIKDYIKENPDSIYSKILFKAGNKGIMQIVADASQDNGYVEPQLASVLKMLAYEGGLNSVGNESMTHKNSVFLANHAPAKNVNELYSGEYRPTYAQQANYRPFTLDGQYFTNPDELSSKYGIHFGDVYTPEEFSEKSKLLDAKRLGKAPTRETSSYRNIIGAVQSISDTELRATKNERLEYLLNNNPNLNRDALIKIYNRMYEDINTYEGKFYMRPSLANQQFFLIGDPKTINIPELRSIYKYGTEEERAFTLNTLNELQGKTITNGTVIGRKLNDKNQIVPIFYNGPTIDKLSVDQMEELYKEGRVVLPVSRQLDDIKIFAGQEKGTTESLLYFSSIKPIEQSEEIKDTMKTLGLKDYITDNFTENKALMDQYTDTVYDAVTMSNRSSHKTMAIINSNIEKHLTDMPFESKWSLLGMHFNSQEGLDYLKFIADQGTPITFGDGSTYSSHIKFDAIGNKITYDNAINTGSIKVLDELIYRLRDSDNPMAKSFINELDLIESANGKVAIAPIQRQFMNTFQAQSFKMDARVYQALVMQSDGNYSRSNGARFAELIRKNIVNGEYDKTIALTGRKADNMMNTVWSDIVRSRRGKLQPKQEQNMISGIIESLKFLENQYDITDKNIVKLNASEIIQNIPEAGSNWEGYQKFIFKIDDEFSPYIISRSRLGSNKVNLEAASNSLYVDLSNFGNVEYNGKQLKGFLLPYQQISSSSDDKLFIAESSKATVSFFNKLRNIEGEKDQTIINKKISEALDKLFEAYKKELDPEDKMSLVSKSMLKMAMPNSAGVLAKDAISPTIDMSPDLINTINDLEQRVIKNIESGTNNIDFDLINKLQEAYINRDEAVKAQIERVRNSNDVVKELLLTGNGKYEDYLRHYDKFGNLTNIVENAMVVGKETFNRTEMDFGKIGSQLFFGNIQDYDNFSKKTKKVFNVYEKTSGKEMNAFLDDFFMSFKDSDHKEWADKTQNAILKIMRKSQDTDLIKASTRSEIVSTLYDEIDSYMKNGIHAINTLDVSKELGEAYNKEVVRRLRADFLMQVNRNFEGIGKRYASEVGILGLTNRYPNFNEYGVLPVRIYFDEAIKGNSARFLGPQFSIFQNLDFDGDNEFIKFLGNGGLYSKGKAEYVLHKNQFDYMNQKNLEKFIETLEKQDPNKSYRIGDESGFKAALLKDLSEDKYKYAKKSFIDNLSDDGKKLFESYSEDVQDLLIAHSVQIKKQFENFEITVGPSATNAQMVKAAMQARIAKEYIGNFSKPNLNVRDTVTYLLSKAKTDEDVNRISGLKNNIFEFLSELEQKGIDTKHVHSAAYFNESTQWRLGIAQLFENANGAENISEAERAEAITKLVKGGRKVLYTEEVYGEEISKVSSKEIAQKILNNAFDQDDESSKFIRSLYELSLEEGAYSGFFSTFKKFSKKKADKYIDELSDEFINKFLEESGTTNVLKKDFVTKSIGELASYSIYQSYINNQTDELLRYNNRVLNVGDILAYQTSNGPIGFIYKGTSAVDGKFVADFTEFNFRTLEEINEISDHTYHVTGVTIKDLNEAIKREPRRQNVGPNLYGNRPLEFNYGNRNFNLVDLGNAESRELLQIQAASISLEDKLNTLFENRNDKQVFYSLINKQSKTVTSRFINQDVNEYIGDLVEDYESFVRKGNELEEYIDYGIKTRSITGSSDAKALIRSINKQIAQNPRDNINFTRYAGNTPLELVSNFLRDVEGISIIDNGFLSEDLNYIKTANEINNAISESISNKNIVLSNLADDFYKEYVTNTDKDYIESLFTKIQAQASETYTDTNKAIFNNIRKSSDVNRQLFETFGWSNFNHDNNFLINSVNGKMNTELLKVKVGYGKFAGTYLSDLTKAQAEFILDEELANISNLAKDSLEYKVAYNTRTLLSNFRDFSLTSDQPDFRSLDSLINTTRIINETDEETIRNIQKNINERATESINKKTLKDAIKRTSLDNINLNKVKIGAAITGAVAFAGIVGHALFNNDSNNNVEVPKEISNSYVSDSRLPRKTGTEYSSAPTEAKQTNNTKRKIQSVPKPKKNRTIYHDAGSGFNFKVSAQSYNKLTEESYQRMAQLSGNNNATLNVNRDNSRITDNWLQNKFANLME